MQYIQTENALKPAGHYSQAINHAGVLYVSGQLPIDPVSGTHVKGNIEAQARRVFDNIALILQAAGTSLDKVIKLVIYITDVGLWAQVNAICADYFMQHKPVRTIVPVSALHFGFGIEIDCMVVCDE